MNKFTNPTRLIATEENKYKICLAVKNEWLDSLTIGKKIGLSYSRVNVLSNQLIKEGHLIVDEIQGPNFKFNKRMLRVYKCIKEYVPQEFEVIAKRRESYYRPNNYYGNGKFFNPWQPAIPQTTSKGTIVKLFEEKDNSYFYAPLKKSKPVSIGSTFSLYDGAAL